MNNNFKTPDDVTEFESSIARSAKSIPLKDKIKLDKAVADKKLEETSRLSMSDRYEKAWESIYNKLPSWRKNEIDKQLKTGTLSNKHWDKDFVQQVTALAELDDPKTV